ncbi:MAG: winged helix-turn-helix transcriptional regulator [Halolamina sp.]
MTASVETDPVTDSVWSGDGALATNDSGITAATTGGGDLGTVAGSADATVDLTTTAATDTDQPGAETPTPTQSDDGRAGGGDDAGDDTTGSESDGDVPPAAAGAAVMGLGAAAVTLLARRSATVLAVAPEVAATVSRLPSPLTGGWWRGQLSRLPPRLGRAWRRGREWLPHVLAVIGYSRYDDSDPLTHETRAALYDLIADSPGTYLSELSERAEVPTSTVRHHLDVLVSEGLVTTANVRGKRRYFSLDAGNEALAAALSDDASAAVIECLAETGPASVSAIAEGLDRDVSTVSHHHGRVAADDLVEREREREGRSMNSELAPEVKEALRADDADREAGWV